MPGCLLCWQNQRCNEGLTVAQFGFLPTMGASRDLADRLPRELNVPTTIWAGNPNISDLSRHRRPVFKITPL
jgi:hypothetical protein